MENSNIAVLRLGHRPHRDRRTTTHVALVARALGAKSIVLCEKDAKLERAVREVSEKFGGEFLVQTEENWKKFVRQWEGTVVHLTMYGEPLENAVGRIPKDNILVVVGAEKVPPEAYDLADFNLSVTNQPHSEVAALAIFLDRITGAEWAESSFEGSRVIVPSKEWKIVLDAKEGYLSDEDCRRILKEADCEDYIIQHSEVVAKMAVKIARLCRADVDLVRTAAMLHDIGRSRSHGPEHGYVGAVILRELRLPKKIVAIVERHVGGGLDSKDAAKLGLPGKEMIPSTLEEKIVCIADKMVENNKKAPIEREMLKMRRKGLSQSAKRIEKLYRELEKRCGIVLEEIEP